jgi:glutaredoxin
MSMFTQSRTRTATLPGAAVLACLLVAAAPLQVSAQGVYRIVGPDGKVTYSDQPPPAAASPAAARPAAGGPATSAAASSVSMPVDLRQAMGRYPVTLYAGNDCAPCDNGRSFLNARGIPYVEKTVNSNDDIDAFKRLSGVTRLPLLTVGGQHLKGFSETEWTQYLDAAGYPKKSSLPSTYRRPAAAPMVEATTVAAPAAQNRRPAETAQPAAPAEVPVAPPVTNPSGIRF